MNMTENPTHRVAALFPLGEITATQKVLSRIPRHDLFAALQEHSTDTENSDVLKRGADQIQSMHESSVGERVFVKTWIKRQQTLVWLAEDEQQLKENNLLP